MKKKIILIITALSMFLVGCSFKSDNDSTEHGKELLEKHQYKEAMKVLSDALEEDSNNDHARAMYMQAMRMLKVSKYEESANYDKAIEELEIIEKIRDGSSDIKDEASKRKSELKKISEEAKKAKLERKQKAKYSASQDKGRIESDAESEYIKENKKEEVELEVKEETNQGTENNNNQNNNQKPQGTEQPNPDTQPEPTNPKEEGAQ